MRPLPQVRISLQDQVSHEILKRGILASALGIASLALFFVGPFYDVWRVLYWYRIPIPLASVPAGFTLSGFDLMRGYASSGVGEVSLGSPDPLLLLLIGGALFCIIFAFLGVLAGSHHAVSSEEAHNFYGAMVMSGAMILIACGVEIFLCLTLAPGHSYFILQDNVFLRTRPAWGSITESAIGLLLVAMGD